MIESLSIFDQFNITKKTPLIVSVSGGVDSMVLLDLLIKNKNKVIVVHFNHQTRKNNINEENLVKETCKKNRILFERFLVEIDNGNFHELARDFRNEKLKLIADKYKTPYILTAHHQDDLAETVLMKIMRGSNLYGYAGIHKIVNIDKYIYIRPLLGYSKLNIKEYASNNNVKYLDDESNFFSYYTRNRIRNTVMPILKQENKEVLNKFSDFSENITEAYSFIRKFANRFVNEDSIEIDELLKEDRIIQKEALAILLDRFKIKYNKLILDTLIEIISSDKPNQKYHLNKNMIFIKSYNQAKVLENIESKLFEMFLNDSENTLPNMKKITFLNNVINNDKNVVKICYNEISFPLIARTRKNGDILLFSYGTKKLKDYLMDLKVPKLKRDELTVLTDSNNTILWVEGIYTNKTLGNDKTLYFMLGD